MKKTIHIYLLYLCFGVLFSCQDAPKAKKVDSDYYTEKHRPQFHFSPEEAWMNDPNGMVYYEGEYHLFYQYYPDSTVWGPMHWGHAISTDLVHWEHLPIALYPDKNGLIFSGSAVVDWKNTSGFGNGDKPPLVAIFSYHSMEKERAGDDDFQTQGIAYSNDKGRTWTVYEGNPVVGNPGIRDFRDPKVIWHVESNQWIMVLAALDHVMFYSSSNLKDWQHLSDFGRDIGSHAGVWECPDLFPLKSDSGKEYWVLIENMGKGNPNGGSGTQYFIGQFDGKEFKVDENFMKLLTPQKAVIPKGEVFESFDNGFGNWTSEGTAFDYESGNTKYSGAIGAGYVSSMSGGTASTGILTSIPFTISSNAINFLIGGGNLRGRTLIALKVDGKILKEKEGRNTNEMQWTGWDVSRYKGKEAQIEIIDKYKGEYGYIAIDEITFADEVASGPVSGSVWLDAGCDNYAGVTWSDVPSKDGRRIFLGWMSNWAYAQVVPTEKWRSAMTIPWTLNINHVDNIPRLVAQPVKELEALADSNWNKLKSENDMPPNGLCELDLIVKNAAPFKIILSNSQNEKVVFAYNDGQYSLDRTASGDMSFSPEFSGIHTVRRIAQENDISVQAFIDHSSIELFLDDGQNVFTDLFFPTERFSTITIEGEVEGKMRQLKDVWRTK